MASPELPQNVRPVTFQRVVRPAALPPTSPAPVPTSGVSRPPLWDAQRYRIRQKAISLGRKYYIEDETGRLLGFCQGTHLRLKDTLRVYTAEDKVTELLQIRQRQVLDSFGQFEVVDGRTGARLGELSRKFWKSWVRDEWVIRDASDREVARVREHALLHAILTRLPLLGLFVPKRVHILAPDGRMLADFRRALWSLGSWSVNLSPGSQRSLDPRLALAALLLMEAIEQQHGVGRSIPDLLGG